MSAAAQAPPAGVPAQLPAQVVLFDGVCVFCNAAARWIARRDPGGRFRFAAMQGATAAGLRARHPEIPHASETLVLVEPGEGALRVALRSRAVLAVLSQLDTPWRHLGLLRLLPTPLTDLAYRIFASLRYRLFGRLDACPVPSALERERFLP